MFWYFYYVHCSACVLSFLFPLLSFCFHLVKFSLSTTFGTTSGPGRFTLNHSLSFSRTGCSLSLHFPPSQHPSLAYTSTRAHSALFRFCLCFPHKSLSELDCMFVSSAASTEKWEAGGLQRCDCYAVRVHCVHVCSIRPRYSVGDEMNRGGSRCLGLECLLQPETILGRRERTVWEGCIDRVNEEECVVKLICLWCKTLLQS